jgi:hypothetical protein
LAALSFQREGVFRMTALIVMSTELHGGGQYR